jgi:3,4-dihydroxy-2-butanone 4-phosphate synthase
VRRGHTEASVALARLAGLTPAGVICEIINDDGSMARLPELQAFCRHHGLGLLTIADLCAELQRRQKGRPAQSGGRTGGLEGRREASTRISRP